jgi:sugar lactone lactonase YvrE
VALDAAGNLYIADTSNQRIRKVDASGTISTVAGNGSSGFSGDGGAATLAQLNFPQGVALDAAGNLYIADLSNQRIRKVDASGTISTVAGNGTQGFSGDGAAATLAQLTIPQGVALDAAGNLYIADRNNQRIRKVDASGTISTVAGNGTFGFSGDGGAATLAQLWNPRAWRWMRRATCTSRMGNQRIRKVDASGTISTVAGNGALGFSGDGGAATLAQLIGPQGVALDAAGNLYIADTNNQRIRKVDASGTISTVAGNGVVRLLGRWQRGDAGAAEIPLAWRWMRRATCTSRIGTTSASAR